jgi:predicted RND superfamily exporter protein
VRETTGRLAVATGRFLGRVAAWGHARPGRALLFAGLLTVAGLFAARTLRLSADLSELLPPSFESVQGLEKLKERFGGIGYVVVVGQGAEPDALRRFADEMAPKVAALPGIRWVDSKRPLEFFEQHALYYLDLDDLEAVARRVEAREKWERQARNPMYVRLDDEPPPSLDFGDIEAKYAGRGDRRLAGSGQAYYLDPEARLVVLLAKPEGTSINLGAARSLVDSVDALLAREDLSRFGPDFRVELTGTFKKKVDQQAQIVRDVGTASLTAAALLVLYLLFHFRSPRAAALALIPTGAGLAWTYGFVGAAYGTISLLTGFLGAILGGLGVEHGIHLLGRYGTLRDEGRDADAAIRETFAHTGTAALVSSLVAALTFASLAISEFRAFREFGVIAAIGLLILLAAYVLVLPAALAVTSRVGLGLRLKSAAAEVSSPLALFIPRHGGRLALGLGIVLVALATNGREARFNFDFGALEDSSLRSYQLDRQVNRILGYSQTPAVILADDAAGEHTAVEALAQRKAALGASSTIDFVAALDELVPEAQEAKQAVLQRLARVVARVRPDSLEPDARAQYDRLRRMVAAAPFGRSDLPESLRRQFQGVSGEAAGFVLAFPSVSLADGEKVRAFAREVRHIALPGGGTLSASGEPMVLADILETSAREAPRVLAAAALSVLAAMWLSLGSLRLAMLCLAPTLLSIMALLGLMPLAGEEFNYLNMLVVPVFIGVTVDAGVHFVSRVLLENDDFDAVYAETGRAIVGGLLTSAVGFGALLLADHPGLESIGRLANLGFAVNLVVILLWFPAVLWLVARRRRATAPPVAP